MPGQYDFDEVLLLARQHGNEAIGSGASPELEAFADETQYPYGPPSWWCRRYMGMQDGILRVENLTLKGEGPSGSVELFTSNSFAEVISLLYSKNVRLENLTLGHHVEPGHCGGGVVAAWFVDDLEIVDCDLYGCGTEGLELIGCSDVLLQGSVIRECSYNILNAQGCQNVRLLDSAFRDVQGGMSFLSCNDVAIESCTFSNIISPEGLITWNAEDMWLNELLTDDPEILTGLQLDEPSLQINGCQAIACTVSVTGPWTTSSSFTVPLWRLSENEDMILVSEKTGFLQSLPNEPLSTFLPRFLDVLGDQIFAGRQLSLVSLDDCHAVIDLIDRDGRGWDTAFQGMLGGQVTEAELLHNLLQPTEDLPDWIDGVLFVQNGQPIFEDHVPQLSRIVTREEFQEDEIGVMDIDPHE